MPARRSPRTPHVHPSYAPAPEPDALQRYTAEHAAIFDAVLRQLTASSPPDRPLRILELGAAPYCFTAQLLDQLPCELTCVSAPPQIWPGEMRGVTHAHVALRLDGRAWEVPVALLNLERELLPFPDHAFDLVLCMDVLPHLGYHPTLMFCEAQRVLRPGGQLLLTLPNGLSLRRLLWLLGGIVDTAPFAARGMYERRQRSSAPAEVVELVRGCGFQVQQLDYLNLEALPGAGRARWLSQVARALTKLPGASLRHRRDYLLLTATPVGRPRAVYPARLYHYARLYPRIPGAEYPGNQLEEPHGAD
jgi:SAM-dependent methyltransferase